MVIMHFNILNLMWCCTDVMNGVSFHSTEAFTAEKVVEYVWPLEGCGEHYFIQEQISQYLGIMSFKRKYPDMRRRPLEMQERDYLKDKGLVSEMACDLGEFFFSFFF